MGRPVFIRNRGKIQATIDNARAMMSASPNLVALAKSYEITRKRAPRSVADLPTSTPQAQAFAKQLKSQGYRFVGPTSVYAFMQNVGVVNDHVQGASVRPTTAPRPGAAEQACSRLGAATPGQGPGRRSGSWPSTRICRGRGRHLLPMVGTRPVNRRRRNPVIVVRSGAAG